MYVMASKRMATELNKYPSKPSNMHFRFVKDVPFTTWGFTTSERYADYKENVIEVYYDADCYACPQIITTRDLARIYSYTKSGTYDDFMTEVMFQYEV